MQNLLDLRLFYVIFKFNSVLSDLSEQMSSYVVSNVGIVLVY